MKQSGPKEQQGILVSTKGIAYYGLDIVIDLNRIIKRYGTERNIGGRTEV